MKSLIDSCGFRCWSVQYYLNGAAFAATFQLRFVRMMFANVHAKIATLLGFVIAVWTLVCWFLVATFVVFVATQSRFPSIAFATMTASEQFILSELIRSVQFRVSVHGNFASAFLHFACNSRRCRCRWTGWHEFGFIGATICRMFEFNAIHFGRIDIRFDIVAQCTWQKCRIFIGPIIHVGFHAGAFFLAWRNVTNIMFVQYIISTKRWIPQIRIFDADALLMLSSQNGRFPHNDGSQWIENGFRRFHFSLYSHLFHFVRSRSRCWNCYEWHCDWSRRCNSSLLRQFGFRQCWHRRWWHRNNFATILLCSSTYDWRGNGFRRIVRWSWFQLRWHRFT